MGFSLMSWWGGGDGRPSWESSLSKDRSPEHIYITREARRDQGNLATKGYIDITHNHQAHTSHLPSQRNPLRGSMVVFRSHATRSFFRHVESDWWWWWWCASPMYIVLLVCNHTDVSHHLLLPAHNNQPRPPASRGCILCVYNDVNPFSAHKMPRTIVVRRGHPMCTLLPVRWVMHAIHGILPGHL